jgi:hypothetical protein
VRQGAATSGRRAGAPERAPCGVPLIVLALVFLAGCGRDDTAGGAAGGGQAAGTTSSGQG